MGNFTFEEMNLMCIYNTGSRTGLIDSLREMRGELSPEETELHKKYAYFLSSSAINIPVPFPVFTQPARFPLFSYRPLFLAAHLMYPVPAHN